jgi:undecaprenyl diphosphate synthase
MVNIAKIDLSKTPKHIAIIMDGNGRWAKQQGEQRLFGHNVGVESVREVLKGAKELGVQYLTLYAFSTENWNRPKEEVDGLMDLLVRTIANEVKELHNSGVRMLSIGDINGLPEGCRNELLAAQEYTKDNKEINMVLALNYSAKWEIVNATKSIVEAVAAGTLKENEITDEVFASYLTTAGIPDPELLIRTSGEHRLSNFLLWQSAYTEFYFTPILWPDFKKENLFEAVYDYQNRERRFGKVSEQLNNEL